MPPSPLAPAPTAAPSSLESIATRTESVLRRLLERERQRWALEDHHLDAPLAALADAVLAGGKRLRPAFCYWGFVATGADPDAGPEAHLVDEAAAALELLHGFALVHDDIMDEAATRRGRPTTHVRFAASHASDGWRGGSPRFGESVAILVGDLAHVLADDLVAGLPARVRPIWRDLQTELVMGQYLDVRGTADGIVDLDGALRIARLKSGRYTIRRPLELGAALGDADHRVGRSLAEYGEPLGVAFQLRDDLLGAFGHPDLTGKPVGGDLREGKPTALLARAAERATPTQRAVLDRAGDPDLEERAVADIQDVLIDTGAYQDIERHVELLTNQAITAVRGAPIPPTACAALVELAHFVSRREH
jgi:geranylgeranyl diphosphate synthase, type I